MKRLIVIIIVALGLFAGSCSNEAENGQSAQEKIDAYRQQIAELNDKIAEIEKQVADSDPVSSEGMKVRVEKAKIQHFSEYFEATGELEAENEAFISPEVSGQITAIYVKEGQKVKKGQLLARLNTSVVEKNIKELKTQLEYAETMFNKQEELWNQNIGSERQYLEAKNQVESLRNKLETLEAQYNMSLIYSPFTGYVEDIAQKVGELAMPGMQLMQVVSLDKLKVSAMISEAHLPVVKEGELVEISIPSFPDLHYQKPITRVGNVINKQNRTFKTEVIIDNKEGLLKPNLLASIRINNYNSDTNVVVSSRVIREDLKGSYLYVARQNSSRWTAKKVYVNTGKSYRDKTEILNGLSAGAMIITDGYSNVADGTVLSIINK